jgi:hypothetical protein
MLTAEELYLVAWYRLLPNLEKLAFRCWLNTGDVRLILLLPFFNYSFYRLNDPAIPIRIDEFTFNG